MRFRNYARTAAALDQVPLVSLVSFIIRNRKPGHGPFALQLRAVQIKSQEPFVVVSFDQLVCSEIPHHDRAAAILTFRNDTFKIKIIDRMVLCRHREPSFVFLERWTFRNGPRLENVVHLDTKVVMQVTRSMLLNDKPAPASLPAAASCRNRFRLRSLLEVSLLRIRLQCCTAMLRSLRTLLVKIASQFTRKLLHFRKYGLEQIAGDFYTFDYFFRCEEKRLRVVALERVRKLIPRNR